MALSFEGLEHRPESCGKFIINEISQDSLTKQEDRVKSWDFIDLA